jgi:hypothetical protein
MFSAELLSRKSGEEGREGGHQFSAASAKTPNAEEVKR